MMNDVVERWEQRNLGALVAEQDAKRRSRVFAVTRMDLIEAVLVESALRTATALDIPPEKARAALVPHETTKRLVPGIEVDADVEVDTDRLRAVFSMAFRQVRAEWAFDLAFADMDRARTPAVAAALPQEALAAWAARMAAHFA